MPDNWMKSEAASMRQTETKQGCTPQCLSQRSDFFRAMSFSCCNKQLSLTFDTSTALRI